MRLAQGFTFVLAAIAIGCGGEDHHAAPQPPETSTTGSLVVDWTIQGAANPDACTSAAATAIEIAVVDIANRPIGTFQASCNAFIFGIGLQQGNYAVSARLLNAAGLPITPPTGVTPFTMNVKSELTVPIDFPSSVFGPGPT
jgi:hypothetical protein